VGNAPAFKRGKLVNDRGYVLILRPEHPRRVAGQYVYEHTLVAEGVLGRYLGPGEVVHHINGCRGDNRPENLAVMTSSEHTRLHHTKTQSDLIRNYKSVAEMSTPHENG